MSEILAQNTGLLFMKVGLHAGETFEQILKRKRQEYENSGMIWWGYGGGTCHPTRTVQPFASIKIEEGSKIYIVMEEIASHHPPSTLVATEYSIDGINWQDVPKGIQVRGSRYAVVLDEIKDGDLSLDLMDYQVAVGQSTGKSAAKYIGGRIDKACITWTSQRPQIEATAVKKISHFAEIKKPYAVFMR
jgi:hypothetical protein